MRSANTWSVRGSVVLTVACLLTLSCFQPPTIGFLEAIRFISEDPQAVVTPVEILSGDRLASWNIADPQDREDWTMVGFQVINTVNGQLAMRTTSTDPRIIGNVDFPAEEVSSIEVEIDGEIGADVRLFWAGPSETFSAERVIIVSHRPTEAVVRFLVANHPLWSGPIDKIRVDPTNRAGVEVSVGEIQALRGVQPDAENGLKGEQIVKVDLDGDTRNAVIIWSGEDFAVPFFANKGARLRFSLAFLQIASLPLKASVVVANADGSRSTVFEFSASESTSLQQWIPYEVELAGLALEDQTIELEVAGEPGPNGAESAVAWANPEILVPAGGARRPNVLLISVDTLRAEGMSIYGSERETTPNIGRWAAADAVVFENAVAPSPWTKPSHASIFTGIDAINSNFNFEESVPADSLLLAEAFRAAGYRTAAVTGGGYLRPEWGFAQGFDTFTYWSEIGGEDEFESGLALMRNQARDAAATGTPFFWFFHTYEVHSPYRRREPYFERFTPSGVLQNSSANPFSTRQKKILPGETSYRTGYFLVELGAGAGGSAVVVPENGVPEAVAAYDSGIAYVDAGLGEFIQFLRNIGLYDETIIVITSDHGEAFGEHGSFAHESLYETILHVPLIIKTTTTPGRPGRASSQVRSIDIAPTMIELAGLPHLPATDGKSLTNLINNPEITDHREAWSYAGSTNFGVSLKIENRVKAIFQYSVWRSVAGFQDEVFDLAADPNELHNVADSVAEGSPLLSIIADRLRTRRSGVRVRFENRFGKPFKVALWGKEAGMFRAKGVDLPEGAVEWVTGHGMTVTVLPGQAFDLLLDGYVGGRIQCQVSEPDGKRAPSSFELTQEVLSEGFAVGRRGSNWDLVTGAVRDFEALVAAALESTSAGGMQPSLDDAHVEQLKALGYLQ